LAPHPDGGLVVLTATLVPWAKLSTWIVHLLAQVAHR